MRRARQGGIALLAVVALLVLGGILLSLRTLNAATWRANRYKVTQEALIAAKEALIARAVADANRPGSLPCPDTNDDGSAELFAGNACPSYIGRLPWRTLALEDLRDGSGERLWYVLSPTHRDHSAAEPINSDTVAQLALTGVQPAANALAVVLAPGGALTRAGAPALQDRSCTVGMNCDTSLACTTVPHSLTPKCNPFNYLDIAGAVDNADGDNNLVAAAESASFNDRALAITADDVMPLVERRVGRELAQNLRNHYDGWQSATGAGFYPWAAPFNPAGAASGTSGTVEGSLPMSTTAAVWTSASTGCVGVGTNELTCVGFFFPPFITLLNFSATAPNMGARFYDAPGAGNVSIDAGLLLLGSQTATWTVNRPAQQLNFGYAANGLGFGLVQIRVRAPAVSAWASSWIGANQWDRVAYYALSPNYAITGNGACGTCITVSNVAPATGKQAVVVMTGRQLAGQGARPVADHQQYLEAGNYAAAPDYAFERALRSAAFNDQPTVVRP
jgi:hypothetical protein